MIDFNIPPSIKDKQVKHINIDKEKSEFNLEQFIKTYPFFISKERNKWASKIKKSKILKLFKNLGNQNINY